ncbi:hypothetical protein BZA05DRAFT_36821 [Tricharina praecox]|uniref:uncharacterized protein n=1 Tax=Tricharina praecox TaxID=43433 RepID=UPI00221F246B|nr:uncharacterized protein BZA05DRAFT_36821 [Tricharina praecox]KAI5852144.1 hypothetical protein BZA05DRAFT_36821 [Tricharina praecox]
MLGTFMLTLVTSYTDGSGFACTRLTTLACGLATLNLSSHRVFVFRFPEHCRLSRDSCFSRPSPSSLPANPHNLSINPIDPILYIHHSSVCRSHHCLSIHRPTTHPPTTTPLPKSIIVHEPAALPRGSAATLQNRTPVTTNYIPPTATHDYHHHPVS